MIERAAILLAQKGLQATSFSEVLAESGAPRGSLYHHFPDGKDEMVLAAIGLAGDQVLEGLQGLSGKSPTEVTEAFLASSRSLLGASNFGAGCAVVAVTIATDAPALRDRAADIFRRWRARLVTLFTDAGMPKKRASAVATSLVAACEGAVILARAERSFEPFDLVAAEQLAMIAAATKRKD